jgi:hypothetical protein
LSLAPCRARSRLASHLMALGIMERIYLNKEAQYQSFQGTLFASLCVLRR